MVQMLQAHIEGYEDDIVVPSINANNFELKQTLINLVQSNQFTGRHDHHNHVRFFNKVTSTFRHPEVPNTTIKLLLFPFSLEGEARTWLDMEPPHLILTWEDLVSKFINQFFRPSKTTYLRNEIINFLQKPNETFNEAWECFKDLLRQCPHHGFFKLHQLDTFYNAAERIAHTANPLALVAQQQPVYHPQNHPTHYTQSSSSRSQQAATRNKGKVIVNSPQPIYDQEPSMVTEDDETSKDKEIDKLMALISLSSIGYENQMIGNVVGARETVGSTAVQKSGIQCYNCKEFRHVARECQKPKWVKDATYHREKMLLCKQDEARIQLNAEQADWRDDTDDESEDQELEAHYMYMAQLQEVSPDAADSGPIFDSEPVQKVSTDDHYNVFAIEIEHPKQSESVHDTYPIKQDEHNVIIDSLDMSYDILQIDQNDDDANLYNERELLASLIEKLKCEIDDNKNRNKFLETSNKVLIEQLKGEIEDFKNKNKSLESSNKCFKEANNKLSETNKLLYNDFKKSQAELQRRNDVEYASKVEIDCAKAKGDLISYKMESQKSFNKYTQTINDLNQTLSEMKKKLCAHQETIYILSQQKEAQIKLYKTREDKELDKFITLKNKVKVLDNIVYKTGQSVQTMNMLNNKCRTSFAKPEFLKKAQRANLRLYDIGFYNDNLALMLAPESDEVIRLETESRSKLSDLIRPFDYDKLNNLYDLFVPQREKSSEQKYFSERSRLSHTHRNSNESFNKQSTLLEKRMDESIPWDQKCKSSKELSNLKEVLARFLMEWNDKGITISELKKLIEKMKGKSLDTKFEKSSVIRQPNAFKSQRPSILGKLTIFSDSLERKDFSKSESESVTQNNVSNDFSKPVTTQTLPPIKNSILKNTNVLAPGIPQLKSIPMEDRVMLNNSKRKKQEVEDQRRKVKLSKNKMSISACNDSLNDKTLNVNFVCATCGKCVLNEKHDMYVLKSINGVISRTQMPIVVPVSTREPKCTVKHFVAKPFKKTVASGSNQKPRNITRKLYERVSKACSWWYPKFTPSRYKWKPKSEKENILRTKKGWKVLHL
nr:reverse transcriptase domain-containing protein [Tanacetum cinerariifolium]